MSRLEVLLHWESSGFRQQPCKCQTCCFFLSYRIEVEVENAIEIDSSTSIWQWRRCDNPHFPRRSNQVHIKCFPFYQIIWNLFVCPSSWYFLWVWLVICVPTWHLRLGKCIHMCDQKAATANPRYTSSIHGPVITSARTPVLIISAGCLSVFWIFLRNSSSLSFFLKILFRQKNVLNSRHGSLRLLSVTPGYFDDEFH